ncbi:MAG: hypothetical protein HQL19_07820, partial [Candidatus Omnitrophica bacterium]|nr:hypothetical protein [Candidatus Omnitrophota bacterium]
MAQILLLNPSSHHCVGATAVSLAVPPFGLAFLAAALEAAGHGIQIVDANVELLDP